MLKPNFGNVDRRIDWTKERIAWVKHLAEDRKMTAREIAIDIGLAANQAPRIFEICKRRDIDLAGQAGRPKTSEGAIFRVAVNGRHADLLSRLSKHHGLTAGQIAEMLVNASFEQGEAFCVNMLDLNAGA